ncbi:hypothetical protein GCM10025779_09130 [Arthrobacter cryoconiti]
MIANAVGGIREATVSTHWKLARNADLLTSRARFNNSSIHELHEPGLSVGHKDAPGSWRLTPHSWTLEECEWWASLCTPSPMGVPWGGDTAPF